MHRRIGSIIPYQMRRKISLLTPQVNLQQAFNLKINDLHFAECFEICVFQFNFESRCKPSGGSHFVTAIDSFLKMELMSAKLPLFLV